MSVVATERLAGDPILGGATAAREARVRTLPVAVVGAIAVALVTLLARAVFLDRAWEIHVDEITYLRLSQSIADTLHVHLYGQPFYLHPPAYFFLEAAFLKLARPAGDVIQQIYAARWVNVVLASGTAILLWMVAWRCGRVLAAVTVGILFALDAFVVRMNSRTFLETSALFWLVAGWAVIILRGTPSGSRLRLSTPAALSAGVLFGLALLTKDMIAFVSLLPLAVCILLGWGIERRAALLALGATVATYVPYPLLVFLGGDGDTFAAAKFGGLQRLAGLLKITGYRHGGPSFVEAVIANLDQFGTTYALIGLGLLALVVLGRSRVAEQRVLALWTACAYALVCYCTAFGTLEEQFFYFLVVPVMLAVGVAAAVLWRSVPVRRILRGTLLALAGMFVIWSAIVWQRVHFTPDNTYERMRAFLVENVPAGTTVASTTEPLEFLLDEYTTGLWRTRDELRQHRAEYVLLSTRQLDLGYATGSPEMFEWVTSNGTVVHREAGPTNGSLELVRLPEGWWAEEHS